ncbi:MAG: RNA-binding cell elongation regulator Jag/EloR [Clostridia bacterium]
MGKFIEVQGNTIAEAIQKGLTELGVSIDEVEREVITQPKSGFFGFGASKAKVRLTIKEVEIPQPVEKPKPASKPAPKVEKTAPKAEKPVQKSDKPKKPANKPAPKQEVYIEREPRVKLAKKDILNENEIKVREFIDGLLAKMGIDGTAEILENQGTTINVNIIGEGLGNVIGRRGDTLDALQYISNLVVKNGTDAEIKVRVDCENYREKRDQTLEKLALKMGHKVVKYKKNMTLEPMNPYERRKIHEVLQNFRGVHTYSTGKEPNRRVVIGHGEGKTEK